MSSKMIALKQTAEQMVKDDPSISIWIGNEHFGKKQITGKVSCKKYKCTSCGAVSFESTNHYGEICPRCRECGWKHPMEMGQVHVCLEPLPVGWSTPAPWKMVKFGDICSIS